MKFLHFQTFLYLKEVLHVLEFLATIRNAFVTSFPLKADLLYSAGPLECFFIIFFYDYYYFHGSFVDRAYSSSICVSFCVYQVTSAVRARACCPVLGYHTRYTAWSRRHAQIHTAVYRSHRREKKRKKETCHLFPSVIPERQERRVKRQMTCLYECLPAS